MGAARPGRLNKMFLKKSRASRGHFTTIEMPVNKKAAPATSFLRATFTPLDPV